MLDHGFLERRAPVPTVEQVLSSKRTEEPDIPDLVTISSQQKVGEAIDLMQRYSISQLPVVRDGDLESLADVIGSLHDRDLLDRVFKNSDALHEDVAGAMQPPLAAIDADEPLDEVFSTLSGRTNAVVVARGGSPSACSPAPTCSSSSRTPVEDRALLRRPRERGRVSGDARRPGTATGRYGVCLGDHAQGGPEPAQTLELLQELGWPAVMGNSDHFLLTFDFGEEAVTEAQIENARWSQSQLSDELLEFHAKLSADGRGRHRRGRVLLAFHATALTRRDRRALDGRGEFRAPFDGLSATVFAGGHAPAMGAPPRRGVLHQSRQRRSPVDRHQTAEPPQADVYARVRLLTVDGGGVGVEFRRVAFDVDELLRSIESSGMPDPEDAAKYWRHRGTPT